MKRNFAIDLLKSIGILYIVGFRHLFTYAEGFSHFENPATDRLTFIVLGLFTLLSGFLVGSKETLNHKNEIITFYKKKILRIYPLYVLAIFLFLIFEVSRITELTKALFLVSMFYAPAPPTLWFVAMIMVFFIVSPFLVNTRHDFKKYVFVCGIIFMGLLSYAFITGRMDIRIIMYFPAFCLGILMADKKIGSFKFKLGLIFLLFAFSFWFSFFPVESYSINKILQIPMILSGSYFLLVLASKLEKYFEDNKAIALISYCSFGMYIFHRVVFKGLKDVYFPEEASNQVVYLMFFVLPFTVLASWVIQKLYDHLISLRRLK